MRKIFFDCEVYVNYFLALFKTNDGRKFKVSMHDDVRDADLKALRSVLKNELVSFNGNHYDLWVIGGFLAGYSNEQLKRLSDDIILKDMRPWELSDAHPMISIPPTNHIDLVGVTPLHASLKVYGCRIHAPKLQDLPIEPSSRIDSEQAALLERYCENDVDVTAQIYQTLLPQIELREAMSSEYGVDLRSKSDAQIAEEILRVKLKERGVEVRKRSTEVKPFAYVPPDWVRFDSPDLQKVLMRVKDARFSVNEKGSVVLPDGVGSEILFAGRTYKLGIGGLHSQEKQQVIVSDERKFFGELDVASFYPSIILGQSLFPEHLTERFCEIYREIFDTRISAKHSGDKVTADTLKIVLNGSYGKFGSKYSFLFSPELLIQTTMTGQLSLLMLIEQLVDVGAIVTSANTDGVNVVFAKHLAPKVKEVKLNWEKTTGFSLEWTPYSATFSESVNSYVAIKPDGSTKTKGLFEAGSIRKGYSAQICNEAIRRHLVDGVAIEQTIDDAQDMEDFLIMRSVKGGAVWRDEALGKVVRWFVSTEGEPIRYASNGNKVAGSDGAYPMMDMAPMPDHLDRAAYVEMAKRKLKRLGL